MKEIVLKFTDEEARSIAYFLRKRFGVDGRTGLNRLCGIAVRQEVSNQAKKELAEMETEEVGVKEEARNANARI